MVLQHQLVRCDTHVEGIGLSPALRNQKQSSKLKVKKMYAEDPKAEYQVERNNKVPAERSNRRQKKKSQKTEMASMQGKMITWKIKPVV